MSERRRRAAARLAAPAVLLLCVMALSVTRVQPTYVGGSTAASIDLCDTPTDPNGVPRPECKGSDIRFEADPAEGEALRAGRHRLAVAAEVARLWAAQARPVVAVTLLDQVHAALRVAEIDARLRALEEEP